MAVVYKHIRLDNNQVFYIGIGAHSRRAYDKHSRNSNWYDIVNKFGYRVEITHRDIVHEEAVVIEKYLISFYGRIDIGTGPLVNLTCGGSGRGEISEEAREKIAASKRGKPCPWLAERNRSKAGIPRPQWSGVNHPNYGKRVSEEVRQKISKGLKGKTTGEKHHYYRIEKEKHPFYGRKHSQKTKQLISEKAKVRQIGGGNPRAKAVLDENGVKVFECGKDLAKQLGLPHSTVRCYLNGHTKAPEWFKYKYAA